MPENLQQSILKVLGYFDLFNYPLSAFEVMAFLDEKTTGRELDEALRTLLSANVLFKLDEFYCLHNKPELVTARKAGNFNAQKLLKIANRISKFLFQFPYVRGIGISGSLSKNVASADADIDYFIITKTNRLWIARTIMHLFKKLSFITGHEHWYCMNYFVDESSLEIREKNIFTAIELLTLLPLRGNGTMDAFYRSNAWAEDFYPNYMSMLPKPRTHGGDSVIKRILEKMFNNGVGNWLDNYLHRLTSSRWLKKELQQRTSVTGKRMALRTGKHYSKPNPDFFQKKVLTAYVARLNELSVAPVPA